MRASWEMQLLPLSSWLVVSCLCERQQLLMWAELQVRGSSDLLLLQRCQHLSMLSAICACRTCLRCVWCVLNAELDTWPLFWSLDIGHWVSRLEGMRCRRNRICDIEERKIHSVYILLRLYFSVQNHYSLKGEAQPVFRPHELEHFALAA